MPELTEKDKKKLELEMKLRSSLVETLKRADLPDEIPFIPLLYKNPHAPLGLGFDISYVRNHLGKMKSAGFIDKSVDTNLLTDTISQAIDTFIEEHLNAGTESLSSSDVSGLSRSIGGVFSDFGISYAPGSATHSSDAFNGRKNSQLMMPGSYMGSGADSGSDGTIHYVGVGLTLVGTGVEIAAAGGAIAAGGVATANPPVAIAGTIVLGTGLALVGIGGYVVVDATGVTDKWVDPVKSGDADDNVVEENLPDNSQSNQEEQEKNKESESDENEESENEGSTTAGQSNEDGTTTGGQSHVPENDENEESDNEGSITAGQSNEDGTTTGGQSHVPENESEESSGTSMPIPEGEYKLSRSQFEKVLEKSVDFNNSAGQGATTPNPGKSQLPLDFLKKIASKANFNDSTGSGTVTPLTNGSDKLTKEEVLAQLEEKIDFNDSSGGGAQQPGRDEFSRPNGEFPKPDKGLNR